MSDRTPIAASSTFNKNGPATEVVGPHEKTIAFAFEKLDLDVVLFDHFGKLSAT